MNENNILKIPTFCRICAHNNDTWCSKIEGPLQGECKDFDMFEDFSPFHLAEALEIIIKKLYNKASGSP